MRHLKSYKLFENDSHNLSHTIDDALSDLIDDDFQIIVNEMLTDCDFFVQIITNTLKSKLDSSRELGTMYYSKEEERFSWNQVKFSIVNLISNLDDEYEVVDCGGYGIYNNLDAGHVRFSPEENTSTNSIQGKMGEYDEKTNIDIDTDKKVFNTIYLKFKNRK